MLARRRFVRGRFQGNSRVESATDAQGNIEAPQSAVWRASLPEIGAKVFIRLNQGRFTWCGNAAQSVSSRPGALIASRERNTARLRDHSFEKLVGLDLELNRSDEFVSVGSGCISPRAQAHPCLGPSHVGRVPLLQQHIKHQ
jgi:hypothetical protein